MDGFARDIILKVQMENFADVNFDEDWGNFDKLVKNLEEIFYREKMKMNNNILELKDVKKLMEILMH